ncbi:hypothetical protein N9H21_00270 [bacterium]|nr:hypothetical protein [bacterium]
MTSTTSTQFGRLIVMTSIPVPAAAWLFGSGLVGLAGIKPKK